MDSFFIRTKFSVGHIHFLPEPDFNRTIFSAEKKELEKKYKTEIAQLMKDHEEEREKRAEEVLEAKDEAQKVKKAHKLAKRDYEKAKESASLQAERMKAMEKEEKSWIDFLKELDEQLSSKFFLRHFFDADLLSLLLNNLFSRRGFPSLESASC